MVMPGFRSMLQGRARKNREEGEARKAVRRAHLKGLAALSDDDLIAGTEIQASFVTPYHQMEMQRRLKDSIDALAAESRRARWWGLWGTVGIGILTAALIALTVVLIVRS
jgi:hypothetical protein